MRTRPRPRRVDSGDGEASRGGVLQERALKQAARELLLAQASDWPFILHTGTSPDYARQRVTTLLLRFTKLHEQLMEGRVEEQWLGRVESTNNIFPEVDYGSWR